MKILLVALTLILSGCVLTDITPGITEAKMNDAVLACKDNGGVRMVTQTIGIGPNYTAFCRDADVSISI